MYYDTAIIIVIDLQLFTHYELNEKYTLNNSNASDSNKNGLDSLADFSTNLVSIGIVQLYKVIE